MQRRDFITLLGGAAAAWPLAARAQQRSQAARRRAVHDCRRRSGMAGLATAFREGLRKLDGSRAATSVSIIAGRRAIRPPASLCGELVGLVPDVIIVSRHRNIGVSCKKATRTIPIVFAGGSDPVAAGMVRVWPGPAAISPAYYV